MTGESVAQFLVSGAVNGAIYALVGLGFVVVARVTGIINFAQGEFAMLGALLAFGLQRAGLAAPLAMAGAIGLTCLLAAGLYRLALQPARQASVPMRIIITVGIAIALQGWARILWGSDPVPVAPLIDGPPLQLLGAAVVPQALCVLAGTAALVGSVWLLFHRTVLGLALRANAANPFAARLQGIDPEQMGLAAFVLAAAVGAAGGGLLAPLSYAAWSMGILLGLKGFTAAVLGNLHTGGVVIGGLLLGLVESLVAGLFSSAYRDAIAFAVLIGALLLRPVGAGGGDEDHTGSVRFGIPWGAATWRRYVPLLVVAAVLFSVPLWAQGARMHLSILVGLYALVALGLTLLLGYAGQISLGHTAFLGIGAYSTAVLTLQAQWPPLAALTAGALTAAALAFVLGRPIFRLRGNDLAMATLGLAVIFVVLVTQWVPVTGGASGLPGVPPLSLGPLVVRGAVSTYFVVAAVLLAATVFSLHVVWSRFGRAMRAVQVHEAAAAACGIDVTQLKVAVLVLSAVFASVAGSLYAHYLSIVSPQPFGFATTVALLTMVVVGGLTSVWGALGGAAVVVLIPEVIKAALPNASSGETAVYEQIAYSLVLVTTAILWREGLVAGVARAGERLGRLLPARRPREAPSTAHGARASAEVPGRAFPPAKALGAAAGDGRSADGELLHVRELRVYFGGLQAVRGVSFVAHAGRITALIGPNGAGKTTTFNAIAGALRPTGGRIWFAGREITGWPAHAVARHGLGRTWQDVRLFHTMSVLENVMVGAWRHQRATLLEAGLSLPRPRREEAQARQEAACWLEYVGLAALAERPAAELPLAQQRLVALARALALRPRLLLLDEPAAGLSEAERAELVALLGRLRADGLTMLLVEHDIGLVMELADVVIVLDRGQVLAAGAPASVCRDKAVIAAYLGDTRIGVAQPARGTA
jgi:branched-chain amino acid transport system permease protein